KKLIFAGISLEVCAAFPAITAVGSGLDAYAAVDASGTFSETKRQAGLLRMLQAGVIVSDYATLMVEILKDNARPEAGEVYAAMDMPCATIVGQIARAGSDRPGLRKVNRPAGRPTNVDRPASLIRLAGRFSPAVPGRGISKLEMTFAGISLMVETAWRSDFPSLNTMMCSLFSS